MSQGMFAKPLCCKDAPERDRSLAARACRRLAHAWNTSALANRAARREVRRARAGQDVVVRDNRFHLREAVDWLKRAQDATPDRGVARGYSVAWNGNYRSRGWQPSYP